ncbi:Cytochrome P450 CYP548G4 [Metarhizium robertsii ARSEF 23]|nr:Cytochrome P450 CYP548G4 [Metarhizium robertsii ARSEF 23]EFY94096.2 Cytochrome P450 CYP548G4 [Metarhizium robertsii ARSEF 23]
MGVVVYRLFFHPYAKHPGPFWAKLTSWYSVYHTYNGDLHIDIWRCHEIYGKVVRYAPNRIIVNTEPAFKGIYGHGKNVRKAKSYLKISLVPTVHPTLGTMDNTAHGKLRRIMNQGLSDSHIRTMTPELQAIVSTFAGGIGEMEDRFHTSGPVTANSDDDEGWSSPKNMAHWCDFFTFDVMSQLVFGTSYHLLTDAENHWIVDGVCGQMRRISFLTQLPELETMKLHKLLFPDARRRALRFSQKSRQIMEERQEREKRAAQADETEADKSKAKIDLFSKLLHAKDPETGEGSDTSSTGMAAVFFYLCRHRHIYDGVVKEVREAFPDPSQVCPGPQLLSCSYLRACIREALRLAPSAGGAMWREALSGGLSIPGTDIHVPAGLEVATGIWSLNHNAEYFPEPFAYRPERWLPAETGDEAVSRAKSAFATFSHGPRNCVGKGLAMLEISLAMAAVISRYEFRAVEDEDLRRVGEGRGDLKGQYDTFWAFTSLKDGPYVQFRPYKV